MEIKKISGEVKKVKLTGSGDKERWVALINNIWVSGFGDAPDKIKEGNIVRDVPYTDNKSTYRDRQTGEEKTRVFHNYYKPSKTAESTAELTKKKIQPDICELAKAITMPKISIGIKRKVQVRQYEPAEYSAFITMNTEDVSESKLDELMNLAEKSVDKKVKSGESSGAKDAEDGL